MTDAGSQQRTPRRIPAPALEQAAKVCETYTSATTSLGVSKSPPNLRTPRKQTLKPTELQPRTPILTNGSSANFHAAAEVDAPTYRTIVADPPWAYPDGCVALGPGHGELRAKQPLPYPSLTLEQLCRLPVARLAARDCRLFLWTTNRWLPGAFALLAAWGFRYRQTLVWHKTDTNLTGSLAPNAAEFLLVAVCGAPPRTKTLRSNVIGSTRTGTHSRKPDYWLDYIEQISPGPYAELFARRARLGWEYPIGDEALGGADANEH